MGCGGGLQSETMVFTTGNVTNAYIFLDLYDFITLIRCTVGLLARHMSKVRTFLEGIAIIKCNLVGCYDTFAGGTIGQLTKFGRTGRVQESLFVEGNGEGFATRNLSILCQ